MRKLIVQQLVTVDGFAADSSGSLDFFSSITDFSEINHRNLSLLSEVDLILLGRRTYELFAEYWPEAEHEVVADQLNRINKMVFSKTLIEAPWGRWRPAKIEKESPAHVVRKLKQEAGRDVIVWGSLTLCAELMQEGLVDRYQLIVCPVVLCQGIPLFPADSASRDLVLIGAAPIGGDAAALTYVPRVLAS